MNANAYTEIHQHGSYIILISGQCNQWPEHISRYLQQLYELPIVNSIWQSWNPRGKFVVSVTSNCTHMENTTFSRAILNGLWLTEVMNADLLFQKSNEHAGNDLQQKLVFWDTSRKLSFILTNSCTFSYNYVSIF